VHLVGFYSILTLIVSGKALKRFWKSQNLGQKKNLQETAFTTACLPCETLSTALFFTYLRFGKHNWKSLLIFGVTTKFCTVQNKTGKVLDVLLNTEARPCNHWWSGKAISVTYSECVFVALSIQHAMRMRNIILPSVACLALPYFSTSRFSRKSYSTSNMYFDISLKFSSETFLILWRNERFLIKYLSFLPDFNESWLFSTNIRKNTRIINLMKIHLSGNQVLSRRWTDRHDGINPLNAELNPICHLLALLGDLTFMGTCILSIFQYIYNKMQRYTVYLYLETALHVSGGTSTNH
jgi:hypothetical protein